MRLTESFNGWCSPLMKSRVGLLDAHSTSCTVTLTSGWTPMEITYMYGVIRLIFLKWAVPLKIYSGSCGLRELVAGHGLYLQMSRSCLPHIFFCNLRYLEYPLVL